MNDILLIIPAHNESENIARVVDNLINNYPQYDYVVINDGSGDDTALICKQNGYNMVDLPVNLGLSGAFQTGMKYAFYKGYEYAIQYDGDGQHNPEYIEKMYHLAEEDNYDIVIGSRFVTEKKPHTVRMICSRVIKLAIWLTTGYGINDPTSGMRLYNKKTIAKLANSMNFDPEPDTIAYLIKCGLKVGECQVSMNDRIAGESYLNLVTGIEYMIKICGSILLVSWFRRKN